VRQKGLGEEILGLNVKLEKKYGLVFANQRKKTCNLYFEQGAWFYVAFPSEIKRFQGSELSPMYK